MTEKRNRLQVSALVTAHNEEEMLPDCLASLEWADEVIVVDSGSTDRTRDIARDFGARLLEREYETAARQKNWAIPQCKHQWVILLDADERVSKGLEKEILGLLAEGPRYDGYWIGRENVFLGKIMRHGGWESDTVIRFFHRDRARYDDRLVHEEIELEGHVPVLEHKLLHLTFRSFEQYWPKVERYARWGARDAHRRGRRITALGVLAHALARFLRNYCFRLGFLDGAHGLILAGFSALTTFLKYALLWEIQTCGIDSNERSGESE